MAPPTLRIIALTGRSASNTGNVTTAQPHVGPTMASPAVRVVYADQTLGRQHRQLVYGAATIPHGASRQRGCERKVSRQRLHTCTLKVPMPVWVASDM